MIQHIIDVDVDRHPRAIVVVILIIAPIAAITAVAEVAEAIVAPLVSAAEVAEIAAATTAVIAALRFGEIVGGVVALLPLLRMQEERFADAQIHVVIHR